MDKKTISEKDAVNDFLLLIYKDALFKFPIIQTELHKLLDVYYPNVFDLYEKEETQIADPSLLIALLVIGMEPIEMLFEKNQANRLTCLIKDSLSSSPKEYTQIFEILKKSLIEASNNHIDASKHYDIIVEMLLYQWFEKEKFDRLKVVIDGKDTGKIDPHILSIIVPFLIPLGEYWMSIKDKFSLVP